MEIYGRTNPLFIFSIDYLFYLGCGGWAFYKGVECGLQWKIVKLVVL